MPVGRDLLEAIQSGCLHIDQQFDDVNVVVDVEISDRLAMLVRWMCVRREMHEATPLRLKKQAQALIDRLTYLDSGLRLIEWNQISTTAQIRGRPDKTEGIAPKYFEIIVDRYPSILFHRRLANETTPFHISNEFFVRLIDDLVRIVRL